MDSYNGKARRRKHRCPQRTTDGVFMPLAPETRGSITSASARTAPLLLRRGQRAEGGNKMRVLRLAIGPRVGGPRATLTWTRMMH